MSAKERHAFARLSALGTLALAIIFCWPLLFGGQTLAGGDLINSYLPYKQLIRDQLASGIFPHWNPLTFGGRPLQADIQTGLFYPPNVLYWLLPLERAFDLSMLLHFAIAGFGMAMWTRRYFRSHAAAWFAGSVFMLCGYSTVRLIPAIVLFPATTAWLPWMLWAWDRLQACTDFDERRGYRLASLVAFSALTLLAGAPQIAFYCFMILALHVLISAWGGSANLDILDETEDNGGFGFPFRPLAMLALALALAVGICAVQFLPTAMAIGESWDRATGAGWEYITDGSLDLRMLWAQFAPRFFGDPLDEGIYWGVLGYHERSAYFGAIPLLLGALFFLTFIKSWRDVELASVRRFKLLLVLLIAASLCLSFGKHSPVFWLSYHFVPGFDRFRVPARMLLFFAFALPALGAWALDVCLSVDKLKRDFLAKSIAILTLLGCVCVLIVWQSTQLIFQLLEMPYASFFDSSDSAASGIANGLLNVTRHELLRFCIEWLVGGLLLIVILFVRKRVLRVSALCLLLAIALINLTQFGHNSMVTLPRDELRQQTYPITPRVEFLQEVLQDGGRFVWFDSILDWRQDQNQPELLTNRPMMFGLSELRGYDPVNSRRYGMMMNLAAGIPVETNPRAFMLMPDAQRETINWTLLEIWNCRIALSYVEIKHPAIEIAKYWDITSEGATRRLYAYRLKNPAGQIRFSQPLVLPADAPLEKQAIVLASGNFAPRTMATVLEDPFAHLTGSQTNVAPLADLKQSIQITKKSSGRYELDAQTPQLTLLVFAESYYPGWRARVDGVSVPVIAANMAQCAIALPPGKHHVEFFYRPTQFDRGLFVSLVSLLLTMALAVRLNRVD